jgi:hypothetical protein
MSGTAIVFLYWLYRMGWLRRGLTHFSRRTPLNFLAAFSFVAGSRSDAAPRGHVKES